MKRYGRTVTLKPENVSDYVEHHEEVWPEVEAALVEAGVRQMNIFLRDTRLFMFAVTDDDFSWDGYMERVALVPRVRQWEELMRTYQEPPPEAEEGEWWVEMEEVYTLNG